ncbi:16S rRNA (cytidine(1402)-2'-O)-methyltransferase [Candidatus Margulisiibacteriota bacterium]
MKKRSLGNQGVKQISTGILFVCATPLGNLEDISLRLQKTLGSVDIIFAEDTNTTKILLEHLKIKKPLSSYHDHNKERSAQKILEALLSGKDVALTSDAGTPGIADPGYFVVQKALKEKIQIVPIPGPSAIITALSASGLPTDKFSFEGFLPRKDKELSEYLTSIKQEKRTLVFYESPHRLLNSLEKFFQIFGDRQICIARELTKKFEEFYRGKLAGALDKFKKIDPRGEFTLILQGSPEVSADNIDDLKGLMLDLAKAGLSKKDTAKILSSHFDLSKNELYEKLLEWEK